MAYYLKSSLVLNLFSTNIALTKREGSHVMLVIFSDF